MTDVTAAAPPAITAQFWLILHEPGRVPELKGAWPWSDVRATLREFIGARPSAYIDVLTIDDNGPFVQHGPEVLQMLDARSMSTGRSHNFATRAAHASHHNEAAARFKTLDDEVAYWRQDAAARLRTAITLARAAEKKGDLDRSAHIRAGIIFPTRAALASALSGDLYYPLCEGCSKPVEDGDVVFAVGDGEGQTGEMHADCARPRLDGHGGEGEALPEGAYLYASEPEYSPEGIAAALAAANAYCGEA